ncbi:MAG: hypothetical protein PVG39_05280 [Desulfobacteraceae bacterium]|jgi:hypothetical protein
MSIKKIPKFLLWFLFFTTFTLEMVKIIFDPSPDIGHKSLAMANAFFWSSLLLIEIIIAGLVVYFFINYPKRKPVGTTQKLIYFITAEFFYFVIGVPLLGGRSYCTMICPMGYFIKQIRTLNK